MGTATRGRNTQRKLSKANSRHPRPTHGSQQGGQPPGTCRQLQPCTKTSGAKPVPARGHSNQLGRYTNSQDDSSEHSAATMGTLHLKNDPMCVANKPESSPATPRERKARPSQSQKTDVRKNTFEFFYTKGQIISKCLFGVFNFFQKTNENTSHTSKNEFICSIFGRINSLTICFRN